MRNTYSNLYSFFNKNIHLLYFRFILRRGNVFTLPHGLFDNIIKCLWLQVFTQLLFLSQMIFKGSNELFGSRKIPPTKIPPT